MELFRTLIGPDGGGAAALQLCARAVILFGLGVIYIRIAGRRTFSQASPLDIVVAIIVGSNLSRIMIGNTPFIGGLAATLVLVIIHRALAMATLRWNLLARWVKFAPIMLVRNGRIDGDAMTRCALSQEDLLEGLRMEQVETPADVHLAIMESGGKISVVPKRSK